MSHGICKQCGKSFRRQRVSKQTCSDQCRSEWSRRQRGISEREVYPEGTKRCADCKEIRPLNDFHQASYVKGRRHGYCKPCMLIRSRSAARKRLGLPPDATSLELRRAAKSSPIGATRLHHEYVQEKVGHDRSAHHRADKNGWVAQHILVAEKKYGILIKTGFTVHHRNRDKQDNHPDNLELRVGQHGKGGDLMPTLLIDAEVRKQAVTVLWQMGYEVFYPGDKRNVGKS